MVMARRTERKFSLAPAGLTQGVCCDIIDLGVIETTYKGKTKKQHKATIVWQTADIDPVNNKPYLVFKRYTVSLDEKANLRKDLESWRGRSFSEEELTGFDLDKLIGANGQLNIVHNKTGDDTYANVQSIVPLARGMVKIEVKDYMRHEDRAGTAPPPDESDEEPCPF
jgi:hypothetical protein